MRVSANSTVLLILSSTAIYSCVASPDPIFDWFRRLTGSSDRGSSGRQTVSQVTLFIDPAYNGEIEINVPLNRIHDPTPVIMNDDLRSLNGRIFEATLQFEQRQQFVRVSSITDVKIDGRTVTDSVLVMCQYYVGDGLSDAPDLYNPLRDIIVPGRPGLVNTVADGVKCTGWIEPEGSRAQRVDYDSLNREISSLLLRYLYREFDEVTGEAENGDPLGDDDNRS